MEMTPVDGSTTMLKPKIASFVYGWTCPKCGRSYAPHITMCLCNDKTVYCDKPELLCEKS